MNVYVADEDIRFGDGLETTVADGIRSHDSAGRRRRLLKPETTMSDGRTPRVAILCGGRGTRITRGDEDAPKPLVQVGEMPILWHVMALYAAQGFDDFILLTGWRSDQVAESVAGFPEIASGAWTAECVDTGEDTPTGGRVDAVREQLRGGTFALTYADGVADIDLGAELAFHREHGGLATITVTRPRSPWGEAQLDEDDRVTGFVEKPQLDNWINGGFMFLEDGGARLHRRRRHS